MTGKISAEGKTHLEKEKQALRCLPGGGKGQTVIIFDKRGDGFSQVCEEKQHGLTSQILAESSGGIRREELHDCLPRAHRPVGPLSLANLMQP